MVWTGGQTNNPGTTVTADWRWLYTTDYAGPHEDFLYDGWHPEEPNNIGGNQRAMAPFESKDYDFSDANLNYAGDGAVHCYVCECGP